ncbi:MULTISPECIES: alpha/beta hydrolase [Sphingobacterium]|jgi:phospholipase/carboxylesterase|uniref:Phospholipase n=1 Tax=Sphingobacterium multivorum TaxID=28454 RepID=A0A2X2JQW9_SPHMU|nr:MULTISPECIES: prolyl oligopeptidase family serine peptidase [Sphingobacterium]HAE66903.1 phospholipase [Sphingobacterium sp.]OFV15595.1 phospholipase [Sphingobacterium sp. HMSC13C05]OJZ07165.1 MAG: phospholipase [Sphingobacterium sp. 40-24]QQT46332.1 prolyl oligopeptidase family serine peptidase [Sphingobacterium multivorum]QQT61125.1 prolyl oligopeptidase family serine peptidase [Sphingobacterium multivorum]
MSHSINIKTAGQSLEQAKKAIVMIHGRGGSAEDILGMSSYLHVDNFALLAPQAENHSWYPYSFIAPVQENEPWLSSAIDLIDHTVKLALANGILTENIYFFGFSQGACLTLEYLTRHGQRYGGAIAIIGGVIGEEINRDNYKGDFAQTPIFIGTSDPDFHVPLERVEATVAILEQMNANVKLMVYQNAGHSINREEIDLANEFVL